MRKVVLDTNCLLISLSRKAAYYPVWKAFLNKEYVLCYTTRFCRNMKKSWL